jgi:hypothetical protein
VVTFSVDENKIRIYKNGTLIDTINHNSQPNSLNNDPLRLGSYYGSYFFNGVIDEFRIYDRILSEDEIEDSYESFLPHHQVTVYCWETVYGVQFEEWISIDDGDYYTEYGYLSVSLPEGEHSLEVGTEVAYFMTFYDGSNYFGPNPTTIDVTSEMTIVALYIAY